MGEMYREDGELAPLASCIEPLPSLTGKWYVKYYNYTEKDSVCVKDWQGEFPCNGRPSSCKELYDRFSI